MASSSDSTGCTSPRCGKTVLASASASSSRGGRVRAGPDGEPPAPGWRRRRCFARCRSRATANRSLAGLAVPRVLPAPLAVLAQRDAIGVVPLGLVGLVVPALALLACEGDGDPDVSTGHDAARSEGRGQLAPGKEKPRSGARSASEDSAATVWRMSLPMPELEGAEHAFHDLPTGVRVHVASCGPADAPPVLALHGWPQHWWSWRDVIRELGDGFRVIAPDMRGFGWSDWPRDGDFRKQRVADDALALLDVLGLDRVCLVGHDWGGWCAILAALTAPERFSSLLALGIGHPWVPRAVAARNAYRLWYQVPLYLPAVTRDGHFPRKVLESARRDNAGWASGEGETYVAAGGGAARGGPGGGRSPAPGGCAGPRARPRACPGAPPGRRPPAGPPCACRRG